MSQGAFDFETFYIGNWIIKLSKLPKNCPKNNNTQTINILFFKIFPKHLIHQWTVPQFNSIKYHEMKIKCFLLFLSKTNFVRIFIVLKICFISFIIYLKFLSFYTTHFVTCYHSLRNILTKFRRLSREKNFQYMQQFKI